MLPVAQFNFSIILGYISLHSDTLGNLFLIELQDERNPLYWGHLPMIGRTMDARDVHILIPRTRVPYVAKGILQMWLQEGPRYGEIVLYYVGGSSVITWFLKRVRDLRTKTSKILHCWLWRCRQGPQAEKWSWALGAGKGEKSLPRA